MCVLVASASTQACSADVALSPEALAVGVAQTLWQRVRPMSNSYAMDQQVVCFCATGGTVFRVTVTGGVVVRARDAATDADVAPAMLTRFRTVDQLFDEVRSAQGVPGRLTAVTYDATYGFPSDVSLDPIKNATDDEVSYLTGRVAFAPS